MYSELATGRLVLCNTFKLGCFAVAYSPPLHVFFFSLLPFLVFCLLVFKLFSATKEHFIFLYSGINNLLIGCCFQVEKKKENHF